MSSLGLQPRGQCPRLVPKAEEWTVATGLVCFPPRLLANDQPSRVSTASSLGVAVVG
jgi:hypothetical protein